MEDDTSFDNLKNKVKQLTSQKKYVFIIYVQNGARRHLQFPEGLTSDSEAIDVTIRGFKVDGFAVRQLLLLFSSATSLTFEECTLRQDTFDRIKDCGARLTSIDISDGTKVHLHSKASE